MSASISTSNRGILVQYDFCTGCHACEVACKKEQDLGKGDFGIKVMEYGPAKKPDGRWDYFFLPVPTDLCDLCQERVDAGKLPACVHHCQSRTMSWGTLKELAQEMDGRTNCVLFTPTR